MFENTVNGIMYGINITALIVNILQISTETSLPHRIILIGIILMYPIWVIRIYINHQKEN